MYNIQPPLNTKTSNNKTPSINSKYSQDKQSCTLIIYNNSDINNKTAFLEFIKNAVEKLKQNNDNNDFKNLICMIQFCMNNDNVQIAMSKDSNTGLIIKRQKITSTGSTELIELTPTPNAKISAFVVTIKQLLDDYQAKQNSNMNATSNSQFANTAGGKININSSILENNPNNRDFWCSLIEYLFYNYKSKFHKSLSVEEIILKIIDLFFRCKINDINDINDIIILNNQRLIIDNSAVNINIINGLNGFLCRYISMHKML